MGMGCLRALVALTVVPVFGCTWGIYDGSYVPPPEGGTSTPASCTADRGAFASGDGFDIDPTGGSVSCDNGAFALAVPPGAVGSRARFTIRRGDSLSPNGQGAIGQAYEVQNNGAQLQESVSVAFANMNGGAGPSDSIHVAASSSRGGPWSVLPFEVVRISPQKITGFTRQMSYFSLFITGGQGLDPAAACGMCNASCASTCCQQQGGSAGGPNPCGCSVGPGRGSQYGYEDCYDTTCRGAATNSCPSCFRTCCQMANARVTGSGSSTGGTSTCACINPSGDAESCFAGCLKMGETNACNGNGGGPDAGPPAAPPITCPTTAACAFPGQICCISYGDAGPSSATCQGACANNQVAFHCSESAHCSGGLGGGVCCAGLSSAFCSPTPCAGATVQLCATSADCGGRACTRHSCGLGTCNGQSLPNCP